MSGAVPDEDVGITATPSADRGAPNGTVSRAVLVLRTLAEAEGDVTIAALADQIGLPRPTVHRLLNLLREEGMVEAKADGRGYGIGQEFFRVAALVGRKQDIVALARPTMEQVAYETGETCFLAIYLPAQRRMMIADDVRSMHALGYRLERHVPMSLAWGASGRSILAFLDTDEIERVLDDEGPSPATGAPLPPHAGLLRDLEAIRAAGYAYSTGQKIPGSRGIAAPVLGPAGRPVASICLTIPEFRFDETALDQLAATVIERAAEISRLMGYPTEPPAASSPTAKAKQLRSAGARSRRV